MAGVPGVSVRPGETQAPRGPGIHGRVTLDAWDRAFLGASFAKGRYLRKDVGFELPGGRSLDDFRQDAFGADLGWTSERFELFGEWILSRYGSPFIAETLETHGYYGELAVNVPGGVRLAARYSGLIHSDVVPKRGTPISWEADSRRLEAGIVYQFWEHVAVKAVYQRTEIELEPNLEEDVYALQLSLAR